MTRSWAGFSLVELLVAAAIMGVLASAAMPLVETTLRRQKEQDLRLALKDIRRAIDAYKAASSSGNVAVEEGKSGYPRSLSELAEGVPDIKAKDGRKLYFLRRIPRDPFHPDHGKAAAETWQLRSFASEPGKPRPGDDVFDVYSVSKDVGMNGIPYSEW
jgi:general secretion pathway protein G